MRPGLSLPRSRTSRLSLEIVVLAGIFALGGLAGPTLAAQVTTVLVVNSSSSPVPVAGTVNVGNLPTSQAVTGTVNVGNFPASQNVNVSGGSVATVQKSSIIRSQGFHAIDFPDGDDFSLGAGFNVTGIAINDGLSEQDAWRLFIIGANNAGSIKVASASGNYFIALPQPILASAISVQCLTQAGCFWSIEVTGYPSS